MTDERTPETELELDGEDQDSGQDGDQLEEEELYDEQEKQDEVPAPRPSAALPQVRGRTPTAPVASRTGATRSEEELPYIDDRASKIWVGAIVAVFALILAYGLLFGKSGALTPPTPSPTPSPVPTATASASPAPSASLTAAPSVTITPIPSVTATPVPSVTATPVPTVVLTASPAPSPS